MSATSPLPPTDLAPPGARRSGWLPVLLLFVLLAALWNRPMAWRPGELYLTPTGDFAHQYWNFWWGADALARGHDLLHCDRMWPPTGASLAWGNLPVLVVAAFAPVTWLWGPAVAYHLAYLASFVLAALGAWLLVWRLTGSRLAALAGGFAYAFLPWRLLQVTNQAYAHVEWLPWLLAALLALRRDGRLRHGALAGLFLGCAFLTSIYYGIWEGLVLALAGVWGLLRSHSQEGGARRWLAGLGLALLVCLVVAGWRLWPMVSQVLAGRVHPEAVVPRTQADLLGWRVRLDPEELDSPLLLLGWPAVFGWVLCLGALAALILLPLRRTLPWVWLALTFLLLAQGRDLRVAGTIHPAPMPADVLARLPLLSSLRGYEKALHVAVLALAVLFGLVVADLVRGRGRFLCLPPARRRFLAAAMLLLLAVESWPAARVPRGDVVPEFYRRLAAVPDDRALLFVPCDPAVADRSQMRPMFFQTVHGRTLFVAHYSSRFDPALRERLAASPFLRPLLARRADEPGAPCPRPGPEEAARLRREVHALGIGVVVLQTQLIRREGSFARDRRPVGVHVDLRSLLVPAWWGPWRRELRFPPRHGPKEFVPPPRQVWMHPSVRDYLEAVLGPPTDQLEDGAVAWVLPPPSEEGGSR